MPANLELPEDLVRRLETIAAEAGLAPAELIQQLIELHIPAVPASGRVELPLISASETGRVQPVTGADLDRLFAHEDFAA
jgi:hypothetical protein